MKRRAAAPATSTRQASEQLSVYPVARGGRRLRRSAPCSRALLPRTEREERAARQDRPHGSPAPPRDAAQRGLDAGPRASSTEIRERKARARRSARRSSDAVSTRSAARPDAARLRQPARSLLARPPMNKLHLVFGAGLRIRAASISNSRPSRSSASFRYASAHAAWRPRRDGRSMMRDRICHRPPPPDARAGKPADGEA